jgi:hypothetical protein
MAVCCNKHGSRTNDFPLFAGINSVASRRESRRRTVPDLDKDQAALVQHDEIDFATSAAEVSNDWPQTVFD